MFLQSEENQFGIILPLSPRAAYHFSSAHSLKFAPHTLTRLTEFTHTPLPGIDPQQSKSFPLKILVVEDNNINCKVILRLLDRLGYAADVVVNGKEACEAVKKTDYELILMDLQMPVMDGVEASRQILNCEARKENPIFISALTANVRPEDRQACVSAGMHDFIPKPVNTRLLAQVLRRAYEWMEQQRQTN